MSITESKVEQIAQQARDELLFEKWPHCFDISQEIADTLVGEINHVTKHHTQLVKYNIDCGRRYDHYTLELKRKDKNSLLIDASFDQFANDTGTPVNIAPQSDIEPIVIVAPPEEYIFHQDRISRR